jgi:hypothetical protein
MATTTPSTTPTLAPMETSAPAATATTATKATTAAPNAFVAHMKQYWMWYLIGVLGLAAVIVGVVLLLTAEDTTTPVGNSALVPVTPGSALVLATSTSSARAHWSYW